MFKIKDRVEFIPEIQYPGYDATADIEVINNNIKELEKNAKEQDTQIKSKEPAFGKNSGWNLEKTDLTENNSNKLFTAKGALNLLNNLTTKISEGINSAKTTLRSEMLNIKNSLTTLISNKLSHGGYSGTGQDLKNLVDNALNKTTKIYNYFEEIGKNQNTPLLEVIQAMANDSILKTPTDIKCTADYPSDKQGTLLIVKNNDYRVLISWQDIRGDLYTRSYTQNNVGDTWYKQWSSNNFNPDSKFDIYQKRVILDSTKNKRGLNYFTNNGQIGTGAGYFPSNYCQVWNLGTDSNYYGMQIAGSFSPNDHRIWIRSTTDNPPANTDYPGEYYGKWAKMYSDLDKPSLSDLGVKVEDVAINVTRATLDFKAYDYFVIQALYLGNTSVVIGSATVFENDVEASTVGIESSRAYISVNYGIIRDVPNRVSTINFRTATGQSSTFSVKGVKIR